VFRTSVQLYLRSVMTVDPRIELAQVPIPVLLIYGGRDLQVPLEHRDLMAKAKPDARVVTIGSANHVLKSSPADRAGNLATYTDRSRPLDPGIVPPIALFIGEPR
jgi:pimeloyl-ACP methyl ester carboxylesterase